MIDLDRVVEFVHAELPDIPCCVAMSGGGCATVYLGLNYVAEGEICSLVIGGPGHFEHIEYRGGRAYPDEFSIGYDMNDPDPAIREISIDGWDIDGADERVIARRMVQLYLDHPRLQEASCPT